MTRHSLLQQSISKDKKENWLKDFIPVVDTWVYPLESIINSLYFRELISFVNYKYKFGTIHPRAKHNIMRAFRECSYDTLKVVILGENPYTNGSATGLAFGVSESSFYIPPSLEKIIENVEKTLYKGLKLDFDITLESWCKQGVLLLNSALTCGNITNSHREKWQPFTKEVIKTISNNKKGIIFMLWGNNAKSYAKYIDQNKHYVLEYHHPSYDARRNAFWDCDHFGKANEILNENNKKGIRW